MRKIIYVLLSVAVAACSGGGGTTATGSASAIPAAPAGVLAVADNAQVAISWSAVAGATSYKLYMDTIAGISKNSVNGNANVMHHPNVTSPFVHTGLVNGRTYYFVVTAVNAAGESVESVQVSTTPALVFFGRLNDTGQTICDNGSNVVAACSTTNTGNASTMPRQDGRFGRDAKAAAGMLTKIGAGAAGFDFTKVCFNGNLNCATAASHVVAPNPTDWACTKDNNTNLTWSLEAQSATWANATTNLPAAANAASRCGFNTGWRLPTARELLTIVHNGTSFPAINAAYFPGTPSGVGSFYWSNDSWASFPSSAWLVIFDFGQSYAVTLKTSSNSVRLVRSDAPPPAAAFTDNGDGTVTDTVTGLMWDRCSQGQSGASCTTGTASTMTWAAALTAAATANTTNYKGRNDWRLPNKNEMESLVDRTIATDPAINLTIFPATPASSYYWSSTTFTSPLVPLPDRAWIVSFLSGSHSARDKIDSNQVVRLVRGGQVHDSFDGLLDF